MSRSRSHRGHVPSPGSLEHRRGRLTYPGFGRTNLSVLV
jgi:hypothetical protein